ncbi:MAG: phage virion morphogenesis protein [Emcibacter sp.]|nr:phage virion morphogenesis protein [Emcibacter sp.]
MRISVEFDDSQLQKALSGLLAMGQDLNPVLDDVAAHVEMTTKERFDTGLAPSGLPWEISRRAAAEGGKTLLDHGHLRDSVQRAPANGHEVVIGSNLIYAAIHQTGGVIRAKNGGKLVFKTPFGFAMLDQVTIPARPYFGLSEEDTQVIPEIVLEHYQEAADGR